MLRRYGLADWLSHVKVDFIRDWLKTRMAFPWLATLAKHACAWRSRNWGQPSSSSDRFCRSAQIWSAHTSR